MQFIFSIPLSVRFNSLLRWLTNWLIVKLPIIYHSFSTYQTETRRNDFQSHDGTISPVLSDPKIRRKEGKNARARDPERYCSAPKSQWLTKQTEQRAKAFRYLIRHPTERTCSVIQSWQALPKGRCLFPFFLSVQNIGFDVCYVADGSSWFLWVVRKLSPWYSSLD